MLANKPNPQSHRTKPGPSGSQKTAAKSTHLSHQMPARNPPRAARRSPAVLVLDEATSALDSLTERLIQSSLQVGWGRGRGGEARLLAVLGAAWGRSAGLWLQVGFAENPSAMLWGVYGILARHPRSWGADVAPGKPWAPPTGPSTPRPTARLGLKHLLRPNLPPRPPAPTAVNPRAMHQPDCGAPTEHRDGRRPDSGAGEGGGGRPSRPVLSVSPLRGAHRWAKALRFAERGWPASVP
jgi:hypothetical protein